jgi:hypothetical protein
MVSCCTVRGRLYLVQVFIIVDDVNDVHLVKVEHCLHFHS